MRDLFHLPDQNPLTVGGLATFKNSSPDGALNICPTWNNPQIPYNGIFMRVNNINSSSSSNLLDVGTISDGSRFIIRPDGTGGFQLSPSTTSTQILANWNQSQSGGQKIFYVQNGSSNAANAATMTIGINDAIGYGAKLIANVAGVAQCTGIGSSGTTYINSTSAEIGVVNELRMGGSASTYVGFGGNVHLNASTSNILSQRKGTSPQEFRLYNTYTDASNGEWGFLKWDANVLKIGATKNGTGVMRNLMLESTNRSAYIASPTAEQIRDILISFGLMAAS